jgi:hypothetical protein
LPIRAEPLYSEAGLAEQAAYSRKGVDLLIEIACHEALAPCQIGTPPGVSVCPNVERQNGFHYGLDHFIIHHHDQELKRAGVLKVKNDLRNDWGCTTGKTARQSVAGFQRACVVWPVLGDLREKFEKKHGKQDWSNAADEWLDAAEKPPNSTASADPAAARQTPADDDHSDM